MNHGLGSVRIVTEQSAFLCACDQAINSFFVKIRNRNQSFLLTKMFFRNDCRQPPHVEVEVAIAGMEYQYSFHSAVTSHEK